MKKQLGKLFIIFGVILCIFALVGCDLVLGNNPDPEKNPAEESSKNEPEEPIVPAEGLINQIIEYLIHVNIDHDLMWRTLEQKINRIKSGQQLLHVDFDSQSEYYFVCAYFNISHNELFECCCSEEYTWIVFKNADEIPEYYNDEKFLVAFQINKASFVEGVVTNEKTIPNMEHFKRYFPVFEDGFNINPPIEFEDEFIYLNPSDGSTVYYSTDVYYHVLVTMPCIHLDGKGYIAKVLYYSTQSFDEARVNEKLEYELGEYYNPLIDTMVIYDDGRQVYGLFEIDEFVNKAFK